jgi:hypothetical protein
MQRGILDGREIQVLRLFHEQANGNLLQTADVVPRQFRQLEWRGGRLFHNDARRFIDTDKTPAYYSSQKNICTYHMYA